MKPQFGFDIFFMLFLKHANLRDLIWWAVVRQAPELIYRSCMREETCSMCVHSLFILLC